jgi:hypothetical protein
VSKAKVKPESAQIKSKDRVAAHGEVFTAEREVNAMLDLVKRETERIDSRFLEPACGTGNFLVKILERKLDVVKKKYRRSPLDFERNSILALSSIYGVDILSDNAEACRERLFNIWNRTYKSTCKKDVNEETQKTARFILERNIVCGNALSLMKVDIEGNDTANPIVFSEWAFIRGNIMQRKDYTFENLMRIGEKTVFEKESASLFDNSDSSDEGKLLKQYTSDYRKLWQNDEQA